MTFATFHMLFCVMHAGEITLYDKAAACNTELGAICVYLS